MTTFRSRWDDWAPKEPVASPSETAALQGESLQETPTPCSARSDKRASGTFGTAPPRRITQEIGPLPLREGDVQKTPPLHSAKSDKRVWKDPRVTTDKGVGSGPDHPSNVVLLRVPEDVPEAWVQGVADMLVRTHPRAYTPQEWAILRERAYAFLRDHAAIAHRLGWTALELWGVHKTAPRERMDCTGLLALSYGIVEMYEDRAAVETPSGGLLTYRRRSSLSEAEMCLLWELP